MKYAIISKEGFTHFNNLMSYCATSLKDTIEEGMLHLIYLRISQINECPYCIDAHFREALNLKMDVRKINSLCAWRAGVFFNPKEMAILDFTESITLLDVGEYDEQITELKKYQFTEKQIVDLAFAISNMNALNRVAITFDKKPRL